MNHRSIWRSNVELYIFAVAVIFLCFIAYRPYFKQFYEGGELLSYFSLFGWIVVFNIWGHDSKSVSTPNSSRRECFIRKEPR